VFPVRQVYSDEDKINLAMRNYSLHRIYPFALILLAAVGLAVLGARSLRPQASSAYAASRPIAPVESASHQTTPTPSLTATATPEPTATASITATDVPSTPTEVTPSATAAPTLPVSHFITKISGHRQFFALGCETAAAKDWAIYFRKDFNEYEFQYKLPLSDNPDFGFVGSVNSEWGQVPPYAYGVYAGPIADLLNQYGIQAAAYKGYTFEQLQDKIAHDLPVIAWVIGNVVGGVPAEYTDKEGRTTVVAAYEHVVIVTGYDAKHIRYMNNGKFYDTPTQVFLNSWEVLGNMVVVDR
jgi:uncharacterized protein YvpB